MSPVLPENSSQHLNDRFAFESIVFVIIIVTFVYCFFKRKKIYLRLKESKDYNGFPNIKLYLNLLFVLIIAIAIVYNYVMKLLL